jgi:putative acetyltransferase
MVNIRCELPGDEAAIRRVHLEAFSTPVEADLTDALRKSEAFVPGLSFLAELNGEVVGHAFFTEVLVGDRKLISLAPLAVRPNWQRQGIGSLLVHMGLEESRKVGYGAAVLLGDPRYYGRLGFVPASKYELSCRWCVGDEFQVYLLHPLGLMGVSGEVIYPSPFNDIE